MVKIVRFAGDEDFALGGEIDDASLEIDNRSTGNTDFRGEVDITGAVIGSRYGRGAAPVQLDTPNGVALAGILRIKSIGHVFRCCDDDQGTCFSVGKLQIRNNQGLSIDLAVDTAA